MVLSLASICAKQFGHERLKQSCEYLATTAQDSAGFVNRLSIEEIIGM